MFSRQSGLSVSEMSAMNLPRRRGFYSCTVLPWRPFSARQVAGGRVNWFRKGGMNMKAIDKSFKQLYGKPCWGLHYERLLNLSINFGKPSLRVREPFKTGSKSKAVKQLAARRSVTVRGEWWLWIYCCYWQLTLDGLELATGSSSSRRMERAMAKLGGQKLVSTEVETDTGATRFVFDLGCVLHCRRFVRDTDDELWTLYKPSGYVLSVYGNGTFSHQRGTEVEKRFQRIEHGVGGVDR